MGPLVDTRPPGSLSDYIALARPDHWTKHVFMLPGIVLALMLHDKGVGGLWAALALGLVSAAAIASANYVINEWLDAEDDAHHSTKADRPAVCKRLSVGLVYGEYVLLALIGLTAASWVSPLFLWTSLLFLASGVLYNVRPLRTKDKPFLDVLSEALNNPLRLTLGWAIVDSTTLPPSSLLLAYWMVGAFLMAIKRFAECRTAAADGVLDSLKLYRRSFRYYSENTLLLATFLYAQMATFFLAVFLIKYRIEYLLAIPLFVALFVTYLWVALKERSTVQTPEKLFRETPLVLLVGALILTLAVLTWVDVPILERLADPHYIVISR